MYHTHTHAHTHVHTYTHTHTHAHAHTYAHTHMRAQDAGHQLLKRLLTCKELDDGAPAAKEALLSWVSMAAELCMERTAMGERGIRGNWAQLTAGARACARACVCVRERVCDCRVCVCACRGPAVFVHPAAA